MDYLIMKQCDKCGQIWSCHPEASVHRVDNCNGNLIEIPISYEDYQVISSISRDNDFLLAMIDLKEKDIIDYNLKMSQFRTQIEQQKSSRAQNDTTPKCPHCYSTDIKAISGMSRGASVAMWGIFSKKINKSFECRQCGYTW